MDFNFFPHQIGKRTQRRNEEGENKMLKVSIHDLREAERRLHRAVEHGFKEDLHMDHYPFFPEKVWRFAEVPLIPFQGRSLYFFATQKYVLPVPGELGSYVNTVKVRIYSIDSKQEFIVSNVVDMDSDTTLWETVQEAMNKVKRIIWGEDWDR